MNKWLVLTLLVVLSVSLVSAGGLSRHSESKDIGKMLDAILAKLGGKTKTRGNFLKKEQAKVEALKKEYEQAEKNLEDVEEESDDLNEKDQAERALILKIKAMLVHDAGSDKAHPAQNCDEVFLDDSKSSGKYWVVSNGQSKQVQCTKVNGYPVLSTGCSKTVKGGATWSNICLDSEDYNTASEYLDASNEKEIVVLQDGYYRIVGVVTIYSSNNANHYFELLVNNKRERLAYRNAPGKFTQEEMDLTLLLKKGNKLRFRTYDNGANRVNFQGKDGSTGYNRIQVSFEGKDLVHTRSYHTGHAGAGWNRMNAGVISQDRAFSYFTLTSDGFITIKKAGFYRINSNALQYTAGSTTRHGRILRNGGQILWSHDEGSSGTWSTGSMDVTTWFDVGNRVEVQWYVPKGHAMHAGNGVEHYSTLEVFYKGDTNYGIFQRGCTRHGDGRSFTTGYQCLNLGIYKQLETQKYLKVTDGNKGLITFTKDGMYRVNSRVQQYSPLHHHGRLMLNGKAISYVNNDGQERGTRAVWSEARMDIIWKFKKGDVIQAQWTAGTKNYAYHACGSGLHRYNHLEVQLLA